MLADGLFDSGVIGVGAGAEDVLAWWREREDERLAEEAGGPHVLDAAPELFGDAVRVVREPAFGVAPWNLDERDVTGARTFRFAGFEPAPRGPARRAGAGAVRGLRRAAARGGLERAA